MVFDTVHKNSMTLMLTIFIKIRVSSSTRVDILWDETCVSLSFDNF